jgi:hypothetical protein
MRDGFACSSGLVGAVGEELAVLQLLKREIESGACKIRGQDLAAISMCEIASNRNAELRRTMAPPTNNIVPSTAAKR